MDKVTFLKFWNKKFPGTSPINYLFDQTLNNRWFRIHSLPESKRYAQNDTEYQIIFDRQNMLIADLIANNEKIKIVINFIEINSPLFEKYNLSNIGVFVDNEGETVYQSFIFEIKWQKNIINDVLKAIADDQIRAYIIGKNSLISPYDGGMNIYLKDTETRDYYKNKYKNWLSSREDGY
jgi:hypothetical protein